MRNLFLIADYRVHFDRMMMAELMQQVRHRDRFRLMTSYGGVTRPEEDTLSIPSRADAVVGFFRHKAWIPWLNQHGLPAVNLSSVDGLADLHRVCDHNSAIVHLAFEHLRTRGYRHFCALEYENSYSIERTRNHAFLEEAEASGCRTYGTVAFRREEQGRGCIRALREFPKPLGLFAPTAISAAYCVQALVENEVSVPGEIGVVTVNVDDFAYGICGRQISSVHSDFRTLASTALDLAHRLTDGTSGSEREEYLIPPDTMEEGDTTDAMAVDHPGLKKALDVIHQDRGDLLTLDQVARQARVPRRTMEDQFVKRLGVTAGKYMLRRRMERAKRMLREGDASVEEISEACGYAERPSFHLAFKREEGMTPVQYRNRYG